MLIDILTLFPKMFSGPFDESILRRAQDKLLVEINIHNLRKWAKDKHKTVDDRPFGGGKGMVMRIDVINTAISNIKYQISPARNAFSIANADGKTQIKNKKIKISQNIAITRKCDTKPAQQLTISNKQLTILLSPQGKVFDQKKAQQLSKLKHLILICGHYEGVDERVRKHLIDEEISIGNYVLTGGEIPAMVLVDSIVRLIPGVLSKKAVQNESYQQSTINNQQSAILDYPQYTRPANFKGWKVPKILLSGNHKKIEEWRQTKALQKTRKQRPELLINNE